MKAGQLRYAGRLVDPERFNSQGKDLGKLVGCCRRCGNVVRAQEAVPAPDPFRSDVYGNDTPVVQCASCDKESRWDI